MLDVVTFKWKPIQRHYRSKFSAEHVNTLASMVMRNYKKPHRFNCITDDPRGIHPDIRIIPLWNDYSNLQSAYGARNPSCYRRLKLFSKEAAEIIGPRFVCMDLDIVITDELYSLWDREEDFVIIKSPTIGPRYRYNGSMLMMTAGCRSFVWETFDPIKSPRQTLVHRMFGSDQAWISLILKNEATWDQADGVYSYRIHLLPNGEKLPDNAKIVSFHGSDDPWGARAQRLDWVRNNYV